MEAPAGAPLQWGGVTPRSILSGEIHRAHAARVDDGLDEMAPDTLTDQHVRGRGRFRDDRHRGRLEEAAGASERVEERLGLRVQTIVPVCSFLN